MKRGFILTAMLCVAALAFSQAALSGTYRYSANAYVTFTNGRFEGRWNAQTPISGTYAVSGTRLTLTITGGPRAGNTWAWTIADANTLRDQDGDRWGKEGTAQAQGATAPVSATWNINSPSDWIEAVNGIRNGGNNKSYVINVPGAVSVISTPEDQNTFGTVTGLTVTIQGEGELAINGSGSLLRIGSRQTVIAKDLTLRGSSDFITSLIYIGQNSAFRMEGGVSVTGGRFGGGVRVDGGTFTMNGGTISGNSGKGGGVYVGRGTFNMSGGTISGNTSYKSLSYDYRGNYRGYSDGEGGGVYVDSGTFNMSGGVISGNTAERNGGGGMYVNGGTFTMLGGTISGNTAASDNYDSSGGGVIIGGNGTFTMQGGTISDNTSSNGGGGVYVGSGTFTMQNGTISGNKANRYGGGVCVNGGTFTKTGGTIYGSNAEEGLRNTAQWEGSTVYNNQQWRNATAGPTMNTATFGFWMND
jgi:hypothetical protein